MRKRHRRQLESWLDTYARDGAVVLRGETEGRALVGAGAFFLLASLALASLGQGGRVPVGLRDLVAGIALALGLLMLGGGVRAVVRPTVTAEVSARGVVVPGGVVVPWSRVRGVAVRLEPGGGASIHLVLRRGVELTDWAPQGWFSRRRLLRLRRSHPGELPLIAGSGPRMESVRALLLHVGQEQIVEAELGG